MAAQDEVIVDLQNYKDRVGTRVVPGRYRVRVDDAELDKTKDGAPMINLWLVVQGGEYEGATVIDRLLPQHPRALFRVVGFMQAIGLPTPKRRLKLNVASFRNKVLEVDIEDGDPYNGRIKSEIRGYYRLARGEEASAADVPETDALIDDLPGDEEMAGLVDQVAASSAAAKAERAEVPSSQAAPVPDEDPADAQMRALEGDEADDAGGFAPIDLENLEL